MSLSLQQARSVAVQPRRGGIFAVQDQERISSVGAASASGCRPFGAWRFCGVVCFYKDSAPTELAPSRAGLNHLSHWH